MSQEKLVELANTWEEAFNRGQLPTLLSFFHGDAVLEEQSDFSPNPGAYRGWVEIAQYWESFGKVWADLRVELEDFRVQEDDVLLFCRFTARGVASGAPIEARIVLVATMGYDKISRLRMFAERRNALEAVGLSE